MNRHVFLDKKLGTFPSILLQYETPPCLLRVPF